MDLPQSTFFALSRHGAVAEVQMNRPEKANGMTPDFWTDLPRVMAELEADTTVRAVVLTGAGAELHRRHGSGHVPEPDGF